MAARRGGRVERLCPQRGVIARRTRDDRRRHRRSVAPAVRDRTGRRHRRRALRWCVWLGHDQSAVFGDQGVARTVGARRRHGRNGAGRRPTGGAGRPDRANRATAARPIQRRGVRCLQLRNFPDASQRQDDAPRRSTTTASPSSLPRSSLEAVLSDSSPSPTSTATRRLSPAKPRCAWRRTSLPRRRSNRLRQRFRAHRSRSNGVTTTGCIEGKRGVSPRRSTSRRARCHSVRSNVERALSCSALLGVQASDRLRRERLVENDTDHEGRRGRRREAAAIERGAQGCPRAPLRWSGGWVDRGIRLEHHRIRTPRHGPWRLRLSALGCRLSAVRR